MSYRIYGAIGFGAGGFIAGMSGDLLLFSFILIGILGGGFLSIPDRNLKQTLRSSLLGGIGFFIGFALPLSVFLTIFELPFKNLMIGLLVGFIGGGMIGIAFRAPKVFAYWGMIGFGLSWLITYSMMEWFRTVFPHFYSSIILLIACSIGGAFLGHAASKTKESLI